VIAIEMPTKDEDYDIAADATMIVKAKSRFNIFTTTIVCIIMEIELISLLLANHDLSFPSPFLAFVFVLNCADTQIYGIKILYTPLEAGRRRRHKNGTLFLYPFYSYLIALDEASHSPFFRHPKAFRFYTTIRIHMKKAFCEGLARK